MRGQASGSIRARADLLAREGGGRRRPGVHRAPAGASNEALYTAQGRAGALGTAVKILIGVAIGIVAVIAVVVVLLVTALDVIVDIGEMEADRLGIFEMLGSYPESLEFKRLYPDYMEETISIVPPHYQYELRSVDDGSIFETDSLIIEYNADTDESTIKYLCIEPDGDRMTYDGDDLVEVMESVCG